MKKLFKVGKLGSAGLSLLELIVSMAILAVISISIGGAMYVSSRSYTRSSAEINVQEEAQVSSNLICDWLVDATSVNPDPADATKFLDSSDPAVGALPYLEIIHPEGNDEVKIRVELVGDKLRYTATNLNTGAVNSGDLASNVSDVSFYTTFGKDRNVKITMNFNVAGRTYSAVTDSTSRNHDFIAASGSPSVADPVISFPLDEVILEPGQNDDKAGAFSFEGTIINGDNTTMVVSGYSVSGVCTVSCTNVGGTRWKVTCAAEDYYTATPSDCAVTFTATKSLADGTIRTTTKTITVKIRQVNSIAFDSTSPTPVSGQNAKLNAKYEVAVNLNVQNASQAFGNPSDAGYIDPTQVSFYYRVKNDSGVYVDAVAADYIKDQTEVTSGSPSISFTLKRDLDRDLYVIVVSNHSGSMGSSNTYNVSNTCSNKATAILGFAYSYGNDGASAYYSVLKIGKTGFMGWSDSSIQRGTPSFELGKIKPSALVDIRDYLDDTYTDEYINAGLTYWLTMYYQPCDENKLPLIDPITHLPYPEKSFVVYHTSNWVDMQKHQFVQMWENESYVFDIDKNYNIRCEFSVYDGGTFVNTWDADGGFVSAGLPEVLDTDNLFRGDAYTFDDPYVYNTNSRHQDFFYVYFHGVNMNNTKPGFIVEKGSNPNAEGIPQTWTATTELGTHVRQDGFAQDPFDYHGTNITEVVLDDDDHSAFIIDDYHENSFPDYGVSLEKIFIDENITNRNEPGGIVTQGTYYRLRFVADYKSATGVDAGEVGVRDGSVSGSTTHNYNLTQGADYGYIYIKFT